MRDFTGAFNGMQSFQLSLFQVSVFCGLKPGKLQAREGFRCLEVKDICKCFRGYQLELDITLEK